MAVHPVETYLRAMGEIRSTGGGRDETSYYAPLENLLNELGKGLKPRVRAVSQLQNLGDGSPDFGLFTANQFQRTDLEILRGEHPERGVIEAKPVKDDSWLTAKGPQVSRYWRRYGHVLVTNYRDFLLIGRSRDGKAVRLESFRLAEDEKDFWDLARHPRKLTRTVADRFADFLRRVMLYPAPISEPETLAHFLASHAREALARVEAADLPALAAVRASLEESLGIKFEGEKGDHFFRSTLVQTLFYGVFSAWVLWAKEHPPASDETFDWKTAVWTLRVPTISALFSQIVTPTRLGPLKVAEVLDWTTGRLNAVDRAAFFQRFEEEHAVQYFYEPFLQAFDPDLRKRLGVWYTPPEIVQYMVARVDAVLRDELKIADGLADPRVHILDPCCGTGAFLVETLRVIAETLRAKGDDSLVASELRKAARERVFGFELLPAPFVVAHLQLSLLLKRLGAPLTDKASDRVAVYLTNALTGWVPPRPPKVGIGEGKVAEQLTSAAIPELAEERAAATKVKRDAPILVVLGNPPYDGFAGVAEVEEERILADVYRKTKRAPKPEGQGLNDLYVRFFRMAERKIVEGTKRGIVCFISNYSWLDGLSHTGMRERYLEVFDRVWVDCLNGDKYKTGKLTPEGEPDPSVFSTEWNREGIQVGTAIALLVRREKHHGTEGIQFRHLWGKQKREHLVEEINPKKHREYAEAKPPLELGYPFLPAKVASGYLSWPTLPDLFPVSYPGVKTSRDDLVVDIDRERLVARMKAYFSPSVSDEEMARICPSAMESTQRFQAESVRRTLQRRGFLPQNIVRYAYRPFDVRWIYWEPETKLLDEKRSDYWSQRGNPENRFIEARERQPKEAFDRGYVTLDLADNFGNGLSSFTPLFAREVHPEAGDLLASEAAAQWRPNVSERADEFIHARSAQPEQLFFHTVASMHSAAYREENTGALRQDWPRIPLPSKRDVLLASAELGKRVAALLDTEADVPGVTSGTTRPEFRVLGNMTKDGGGQLDPDAGDLAVTAGWGHAGKGGVTMPGKGRTRLRDYTPQEREALAAAASAESGLSSEQVFALLGERTLDVYLNGAAHWRCVPERVWEYTLGGYQVLKKWLSYRERDLLGRDLRADEAQHFRDVTRRIAALLLLGPALDANYLAAKADPWPWPGKE